MPYNMYCLGPFSDDQFLVPGMSSAVLASEVLELDTLLRGGGKVWLGGIRRRSPPMVQDTLFGIMASRDNVVT